MTVRHAALAAGTAFVLGLTVYLFIQVRSRPAAAEAPVARSAPAPAVDEETGPDPAPRPAVAPSTGPTKLPTPVTPTSPVPQITPPEGEQPPVKSAVGEFMKGAGNQMADPKTMAVMDEANKAYDRGDFDEARAVAQRVLAQMPGNARMLRVIVSAACISGDAADAQKAYLQLSPLDREQMKVRCARYGMTFKDE